MKKKHLKVKHLGREDIPCCDETRCSCPCHSPQVEECEPTIVDLNDPIFNAIWSEIKKWDISRSQNMEGRRMYAGATGTDVMTILNIVRPFLLQARADERREIIQEIAEYSGINDIQTKELIRLIKEK